MSSSHSSSHSQPQPIPAPNPQQPHPRYHPPPIPSTSSQEFSPALPSYDFNPRTDSYHEQPLPPPNFLPIFTLVEDSSSSEHFHPKVHYVFADDPFDPVSAFDNNDNNDNDNDSSDNNNQKDITRNERSIIISLSPDLTSIKSAYSLSQDWQILNVSISSAPQSLISDDQYVHNNTTPFSGSLPRNSSTTSLNTITGVAAGSSPEVNRLPIVSSARPGVTESLMLTIEGTKVPGNGVGEMNFKKLEDMGDTGLYELASTFSEKMSMIKRVIEFGMAQDAGKNNDGNGNNNNNNMVGAEQQSGDVGSPPRPPVVGTGNSSSPNLGIGLGMGMGMAIGGFRMERGESTRSTS